MPITTKLTISTEGFKKGLKDAEKISKTSLGNTSKAARDASKVIESIGNKAASMAGKAGPAIQGVTAALSKMGPIGKTTALGFASISLAIATTVSAAWKFANVLDSIAKRAKGLDMTAQGFFALEGAVIKAGADIEKVSQIVLRVSDALQKAAEGSKAEIDAFKALGVSWANLSKMSPENQIAAIVSRIRELKKEGKDIPAAFRNLVGRRGMNELNRLAADETFEANLRTRNQLSPEAVRNSEEFTTSVAELKQTLTAILSSDDTLLNIVKKLNSIVTRIAEKMGANTTPPAWTEAVPLNREQRQRAIRGATTSDDIASEIYSGFYSRTTRQIRVQRIAGKLWNKL